MVSHNPFVVNHGFDGWCNYPEGGFLMYPHSMLRVAGQLTRTISALWHMEQTPRPTRTPAALARNACLPVDTAKKQLRTLIEKETVFTRFTERGLEYFLHGRDYGWFAEQFSPSQPHVKIPRVWFHYWPDAKFSELLLLGLYRFRCVAPWGDYRACTLPNSEIAELMGFNPETWRRAGVALERRGLIQRDRQSGGYAVTLPGSNREHSE